MEPLAETSPVADSVGVAGVSADGAVPELPAETAVPPEEGSAWRDELSERLHRYRARRKAPPPRYPSLRLPFEASDSVAREADGTTAAFQTISQLAVALDGSESLPAAVGDEALAEPYADPKRRTATIIEFPRFAWGPPPPLPDQLAEPVGDLPRILEVPEVAPTPPALGGITIEAAKNEENAKRLGIDVPVQNALVGRRVAASFIDWLIVAAASALFGFIFWKVTSMRPPRIQLLALAGGIPCLLWLAYQYLLIVYAATTPGLRLTGLVLSRFDDRPTTRSLRRWRMFASYLSAVSLGMGYAWVFLDEDGLCWHDRITHTYLAPRKAE
jgi:hypothetical protein